MNQASCVLNLNPKPFCIRPMRLPGTTKTPWFKEGNAGIRALYKYPLRIIQDPHSLIPDEEPARKPYIHPMKLRQELVTAHHIV